MKNLGKIALLLFLIPHAIYASVTASVDSKSVSMGDVVTLSLTISGEDITKPDIFSICDSDILATSSQTSIQMINMDYKKSTILNYQFLPKKSCEIKAISVEIDGKTETTQPISIEVKPASATKDANFILSLVSDKTEVFVGEPFTVTLLFKQHRNAEAVDSNFVGPELQGFWMKSETKPTRYEEGDYIITKLTYTLAAQREGTLNITPAQMKIASRANSRDSWGSWVPQIKWRSYFSNELSMIVKPLPLGVDLIGNFKISAMADKIEINPNEAVNVTLEVRGEGNLEDIKTFKPSIEGVSVFDEKIVVQNAILSQKMAFVADENFTIPPFSLKFFNPKTKEIESITSKEIKITVKGSKTKHELNIKRQNDDSVFETPPVTQNKLSTFWIIAVFILGLACGILLMLLKPWRFFGREKTLSLREPKIILVKLLPYKDDEEVAKLLELLENKIYSNGSIEIDKNILKRVFKRYNIK